MTSPERVTGTMQSKIDQGGQVGCESRVSLSRRAVRVTAALGALLCVLALSASTALADRTFDSAFGVNGPYGVAFDGSGNAWVSQYGGIPRVSDIVFKRDPYPSQTILTATSAYPPATGNFLHLGQSIGFSEATNELFLGQSNGRTVEIFDENGVFSRGWTAVDGNPVYAFGGPVIYLAVDNTNTFSRGRIYLSLRAVESNQYKVPENTVEAFDAEQRTVDFPATADYIVDNKLTGTPSGAFGEVQSITVDADGNIFVLDTGHEVVDEFDSTGTFVRTFPGHGNLGASGGVTTDPTNGNVLIEAPFDGGVAEYDSSGNFLGTITQDAKGPLAAQGTPAVNPDGYLYVPAFGHGSNSTTDIVDIYKPKPVVPAVTYKPVSSPTTTSGTLNATVDPDGGGSVITCSFQYGTSTGYGLGSIPCSPDPTASPPGSNFASPTDVSAPISGLTTETVYHYRVVVANANGTKYGPDQVYAPHKVVGLRTDPATNITESGATLNGSLVGDGTTTHYLFEWGRTAAYGNTSATPPGTNGGAPSGPGQTALSFDLNDLSPFSTYHYRIVAQNGGGTSYGADSVFTTPPGIPSVVSESTSEVHADRAVLRADINPNGANTTFHFEYVTDAQFQNSEFAGAVSAPASEPGIGKSKHPQKASVLVDGLMPGTVYHYRAVGSNMAGTGTSGNERTFKTFPFKAEIDDPCPNAHVRQQTGAALLLDCRAYEIVSAANANGYDVESSLVPGQTPFGGYGDAEGPSQILYGIHDGALSTGNPTNRGVDPYVATRGDQGWNTSYVGIPANNQFAGGPFSSPLLEADGSLDSFAFGGAICTPCFADGSTGIPIHTPGGDLAQGMAGSIPQPLAEPAGFIGKHFSADGSHFVFGSTSQFEPDGNDNGDVSIYDRDLGTGVTQVVSKTPAGDTMTGAGIGELDISADGSRIVIGRLISTDSAGNRYWHLYMSVGDSDQTIDLTPGATDGVLYDGMTSDGTKVYFTARDALTTATDQDTDGSADIFRADVSGSSADLTRISTGSAGTGDTDSCDPAANTVHERWNSIGSAASCDVVAIGGGGGVAGSDGSIYLLSPELLDGASNGVQDAPNLYIARPGSGPRFVATLESSANAPLPPSAHPFRRSFGTFAKPTGVAVDHASGDVYALDVTSGIGGYVQKFDSSGNVVTDFGPNDNGKIDGSGESGAPTGAFQEYGELNLPTEIAVDNSPSSPSYGDLYVPDLLNGVVDKFDSSGNYISQLSVGFPSGVAVNSADGHVYVSSFFGGTSVFDANGSPVAPTSFSTPAFTGTSIAVDSSGYIYVADGSKTQKYNPSGTSPAVFDAKASFGVAVDPSGDHVYVDEGKRVVEFDTAGAEVGMPTGSGSLSGSVGVAADSGNLYITNQGNGKVFSYGPGVTPPDPETDNPVVVNGVSQSGVRNTGDFQISPSGDDAVFTSTLPLTGYDNASHREVFRSHDPGSTLDCASCNPTGEQASGEAELPSQGLGLADDGKVFFNSIEGLVDRDLNGKEDAYEWEVDGVSGCEETAGCVELISTGFSPFASSLLSVNGSGTDAYFFTRDKLVTQDENGNNVKVYDARSLGGYPFVPPAVPCKASDECHGPSTPAPAPPNIKSTAGTPTGPSHGTCKRGFAKKRGRCVKKRKHRGRKKSHRSNSTRRHG
jgi:hypothetical protein